MLVNRLKVCAAVLHCIAVKTECTADIGVLQHFACRVEKHIEGGVFIAVHRALHRGCAVGKKAAYLVIAVQFCIGGFPVGKGNTYTVNAAAFFHNAHKCGVAAVVGKVVYGKGSVGENIVYTQTVSTVGFVKKLLVAGICRRQTQFGQKLVVRFCKGHFKGVVISNTDVFYMAEAVVIRGMGAWGNHPFQCKGKIVGSNGNLFRFAQIKTAVTAQAECVSQSVSRYVVAFAYIWHHNAAAVLKKPVVDICQHQKFVVVSGNLRVKVFRHTVQ